MKGQPFALGWSVERDEEGRLRKEWEEAHGLAIGPETNGPLWDGARLDYDVAVGGLMAG